MTDEATPYRASERTDYWTERSYQAVTGSPVEPEVEAAIKKLETQLQRANSGDWIHWDRGVYTLQETPGGVLERNLGLMRTDAVAGLVVTLRASAEGQLAILRNYREVYGAAVTPYGLRQAILKLARDILGKS